MQVIWWNHETNFVSDTKYMMEFKGLPGIAWDESNQKNCKKLSDKLYDTKDIIDTKGLMELLEMQVIWWICLMNSYKTLWYKVYHGVLRIAGIAWDASNLMNLSDEFLQNFMIQSISRDC